MKKWFGNDEDGLSIQDVIALGAFIMWAVITAFFVPMAFAGTLTSVQVDFYGSFSMLPLTVVGGVYGVRAIGGAINRWQQAKYGKYREDYDDRGTI